ncbi:MAG: hypothetical protein EXX96DRAFT_645854 [Benjaminiella poitrasii]|nr:MAG: hypothetical protein EXX96DRAFT_645854 [Benjaminiella poitrasii]
MTTRFHYEDGQGRMVDEQGNDTMDCVEEVTPFHLKTLTRIRAYCEKQEDVQLPFQEDLKNLDVDVEDVLFYQIKLFNAAKSGRLAGGINDRTAQKWAKKLTEDKDWNIFEKQTNLVKYHRPKQQLDDRHKLHLLNFYDDYPQARIVDAMDLLTQKFSDLSVKKSTVHNFLKTEYRKDWVIKWNATDMNYLENCIFVDESGFNINMRPPSGW